MGRLHRAVRSLLVVYVCLLIVTALALAGAWKFQHVRVLSVQTDSMAPTFRSGDAVIADKAPSGQLRVGQVVSYISPANPNVLVSHRIISVDNRSGLVTTKGDNAARQDVAFSPNLVVGRVRDSLPLLGYPIDFLHKPIGLAIVVYLPAGMLVLSEIRRLARHYGRGYYCLFSFR